MLKAYTSLILFFLATPSLISQTPSTDPCPKIEITTPSNGYMGRGETYYIVVNLGKVDTSTLKFRWTLPEKVHFQNVLDVGAISFVANEELNGLDVAVSVEIDGLPNSCPNSASTSFRILFDPGPPQIIDEYEQLSARDERVRLANIATQVLERGSGVLFVIGYERTDTKTAVRYRVQRIISVLMKKYKISNTRLVFVFSESDRRYTKAIVLPAGYWPSMPEWNLEIDKLRIPRRSK